MPEHRDSNAILEKERITLSINHARRSTDTVDRGHEALDPLNLRQHLTDVDPDHVGVGGVSLDPSAVEQRPQPRPRPKNRKHVDVPVGGATLRTRGDVDAHGAQAIVARVEDRTEHRLRTLRHASELALAETAGTLDGREEREVDVLVRRHELQHDNPELRKNVVGPDVGPVRRVRRVPRDTGIPEHKELLEVGGRPIVSGPRGSALDRDARHPPLAEEIGTAEPRLELLRRPPREELGSEALSLIHELSRGLVALHRQKPLATKAIHDTAREVTRTSIPQINDRKLMQLVHDERASFCRLGSTSVSNREKNATP